MAQVGMDYSGSSGPASLHKQGHLRTHGTGLPSITIMSKGWPETAFGKANDSTLAKADQPMSSCCYYWQISGTNLITGHKRGACSSLLLEAYSLVVAWGRKGIDQTLNVVKGTNRDREKAVRNRYKVFISAISCFLRQIYRLGQWPALFFLLYFFIAAKR